MPARPLLAPPRRPTPRVARAEDQDPDQGFTLIELLVVVIIIGILAAIAIPVYLGVQNNAKDSAVESDLSNLKVALISLQAQGTPADTKTTVTASSQITSGQAAAGATFGASTTSLTFYPGGTGFCVLGLSKSGRSFAATDALGVTKGSCTSAGAYSTTSVTTVP